MLMDFNFSFKCACARASHPCIILYVCANFVGLFGNIMFKQMISYALRLLLNPFNDNGVKITSKTCDKLFK